MLRSVIPLARSLGVHARWFTIQGHEAFFHVTKKFHNTLQGVDQPIALQELFDIYLDNLAAHAKNPAIESDLIVVHDPQPAALDYEWPAHGQCAVAVPILIRQRRTRRCGAS